MSLASCVLEGIDIMYIQATGLRRRNAVLNALRACAPAHPHSSPRPRRVRVNACRDRHAAQHVEDIEMKDTLPGSTEDPLARDRVRGYGEA